MLCTHGLERIGNEFVDQPEKPRHVRKFSMSLKRLFVNPFRVNKVGQRFARRFVDMDSNTARFCSRGLHQETQLVK